MYLIVLFEKESKTGPVAKEWLSDGLAWWPPYKDKFQILRSVQKKVVPNPSKGWKQFAARVLYESDSIDKIREKWERSCETSDLNTDKEQELTSERQRRKPKRLRSPSPSSPSEEDDLLPKTQPHSSKTHKKRHLIAPPPLPVVIRPNKTDAIRAVTSQPRPVLSNSNQNTVPIWQPSKMAPSQLTSQLQPVPSNDNRSTVPIWQPRNMDSAQLISQPRSVSSNSDHSPDWQNSNFDSSQCMPSNLRQELEARPERPAYTELTTVSFRQGEVEARPPTPLPDERMAFPEYPRYRLHNTHQLIPTNCTAVERVVLEQLGELHLKVDHLTSVVQTLCQNRAQNHQPQINDFSHLFPISTLEELDSFDERLRQDGDFKKHVIAKLSITGGISVKKTVWRVCKKVFTPELATQLNWCGRGQKTGIKSRPVREILLLSVLRNGALTQITEAEVELAIQNWLRLSQDRIGGRRRQRPEL